MQILIPWAQKLLPYLLCIVVGFILAHQGCQPEPETIVIEKPVPTIEKIEVRDTVRFGVRELRIDTIRDTITNEVVDIRLDTLLKVDTLKIVDAWLTEVAKYDTTLEFSGGFVNVKWQNHQNLSEHLEVTLLPKSSTGKLSVMLLAKVGTRSDFKSEYYGNIGAGLLFEKKGFVFGGEYSYSGHHTVNGVVGYRLR